MKFIKDSNPIELNILIISLLYGISLIIILTPIILIGLSVHPEGASVITEEPTTGTEQTIMNIKTGKTIIEMIFMGTITELVRRSKSEKFKFSDSKASKFFIYIFVLQFLYVILNILLRSVYV